MVIPEQQYKRDKRLENRNANEQEKTSDKQEQPKQDEKQQERKKTQQQEEKTMQRLHRRTPQATSSSGGDTGRWWWRGVVLAAAVSSTLLQVSFAIKEMPTFLEPISNVTVPSGRDIKLACVVDHLGSYKLAWIQVNRSAILTVGNHVITRNNRIGVSHDGHRTWYLTIKAVRPVDEGIYMCQINTEIAISQTGMVRVVVPPYIKDEMSSRDVRLLEGQGVTLACSARGSPIPTIKWRREDNTEIRVNNTLSAVMEVPGPLLRLSKVSRTDMGAYLCIATNGVPPSVSKRIEVEVKFLPTVYVPHQLVGVPLGQEVTIECYIEAWPPGLNYWKRPNGIEILHSDTKYAVSEVAGSQKYKTHMLLTIKDVSKTDIGDYNCIANNSQGGAEQVVRLSASQPIPNKNRNALEKGYNNKDSSYGKPSLSAVNFSKDRDTSSASAKDEMKDLRNLKTKTFNNQREANKRLQNSGFAHDFSSSTSSSSSSSASGASSYKSHSIGKLASLLVFLLHIGPLADHGLTGGRVGGEGSGRRGRNGEERGLRGGALYGLCLFLGWIYCICL